MKNSKTKKLTTLLKWPFHLCAIILSQPSQALPLLSETQGSKVIGQGIVTLYKDSQDPNLVYFFPNSTRFSRDQKDIPLFNFAYWGVNQTPFAADAGGYLTMSTHLASDADQNNALEAWMKQNPQMKVAVLPVKSSVVSLQTTEPNATPLSMLFKEYNFSKVGGRAEDTIGINAILTARGAQVLKKMLLKDQGGQYVKFDYCYTIEGLGPNMDALIKVDMDRVYTHFETNTRIGWKWFSSTIRTVVEKLHKENAVTIEMNGGDATQWEILNKVAETITARLFVPEITATNIPAAKANRLFSFNASHTRREEHASETWRWKRQDLEEREICTAIAIKDLSGHLDRLVTDAD